jgi:hypothetical protein
VIGGSGGGGELCGEAEKAEKREGEEGRSYELPGHDRPWRNWIDDPWYRCFAASGASRIVARAAGALEDLQRNGLHGGCHAVEMTREYDDEMARDYAA